MTWYQEVTVQLSWGEWARTGSQQVKELSLILNVQHFLQTMLMLCVCVYVLIIISIFLFTLLMLVPHHLRYMFGTSSAQFCLCLISSTPILQPEHNKTFYKISAFSPMVLFSLLLMLFSFVCLVCCSNRPNTNFLIVGLIKE